MLDCGKNSEHIELPSQSPKRFATANRPTANPAVEAAPHRFLVGVTQRRLAVLVARTMGHAALSVCLSWRAPIIWLAPDDFMLQRSGFSLPRIGVRMYHNGTENCQ